MPVDTMSEIRIAPPKPDTADLLTELLLFESRIDHSVNFGQTLHLVNDIINRLELAISEEGARDLHSLYEVLDCFYLDLAFSTTAQDMPESLLNSLVYAIHYHTGENLSLSILLNHALCELGFDSRLGVVDLELRLTVTLTDGNEVIIDGLCGEVAAQEVEPGQQPLGTLEFGADYSLDKMNLMQIFFTQQKMAFTEEQQFDKALHCIEFLLQSMPDDPYQRRDRGFLLHQLDCPKLAKDDFEFFIERCPEDPAAELLRLQIDDFDNSGHTVH